MRVLPLCALALCLLVAGVSPSLASEHCIGARWRDAERRAAIGAIRWDAWFDGSPYERFLDPGDWHSRVPFYGTILSPSLVQVRSDSGLVMDQEIGYAARAGLTYWAFNYYHPGAFSSADSYNYGLRLYLTSPCRDQINFSLILQGNWLGPVDAWPATVSALVELFQTPGFQQAAGGRPLLYFYDIEPMSQKFGSWDRARVAMDALRRSTQAAGLPDPYLVSLAPTPARSAELAALLGFDAIGAYSATPAAAHGERPFDELRQANEAFWAEAAATGKPVIPPVSTGWDPRPRTSRAHGHDTAAAAPWYRAPAPDEFAEHLARAVAWAETRPEAAARSVLIYAWNEHDEGGWLTPTLADGTSRLDAIERTLREQLPPDATPPDATPPDTPQPEMPDCYGLSACLAGFVAR